MTYDLNSSLGYALTRAARAVERRFELELRSVNLTRLQWILLLGIGQNGLSQPSDLSDHFGFDRAVVSRGLNALEKLRYIQRVAVEGDGRRRSLSITATGLGVMHEGILAVQRSEDQVLEALRPRHKLRLASFLAEINTSHSALDPAHNSLEAV